MCSRSGSGHDRRGPAHRGARRRPGRRLPALGLAPRARAAASPAAFATTPRGHDRGLRPRTRSRPSSAPAGDPPPAARIRELDWHPIPTEPADGVRDRARAAAAASPRVSIPPDLATCARLSGARSSIPRDRRYRYPFTNCTNCGPRFTIARDVPYDRPATTMARFPDVRRRASASTTTRSTAASTPSPTPARPAARVSRLLTAAGRGDRRDDPIRRGRAALAPRPRSWRSRGIGGFHLACDATSRGCGRAPAAAQAARREAVRRDGPRPRRGRAARPMLERRGARPARSRPSGRSCSSRRRDGSALAPEVAPGNPLVGLLLPYTPLHHLLLRRCGAAAGDDLRQPVRRADRLSQRRGARAPRRRSPTSSCCTTGRSSRAATTRSRA